MNWTITDDPVADWEDYCEAQDIEWEMFVATTPICRDCERHVAEVDDFYYEVDDDTFLCESCLKKRMRVIH